MMRFRYGRAAVRSALFALAALSGCATHTTKRPVVAAQPLARTTSNEIPSARRPVKAREHEFVASTQIEPCVFRGSLDMGALLYSQPDGGQGIAWLYARRVQIDRLELPSTPGGRAKVVLHYPIDMEAYIDETAHIVQIVRRVDVVPGHVWLEPGTLVHASLLSRGTAKITMQFSDGTMPSEHVTPLPCADLSLAQPTRSYEYTPAPKGDPVYLRPERISIHESAGGREIAAIQVGNGLRLVWLLEKKPGWLHVQGDYEFYFNGWIPATSVSSSNEGPGEFGMIGLLAGSGVTHQVTKPFPLRIAATDAAPVIAKAATGAEILIEPGPPGYRVIQFGMGVSAPDGASFVAREADLKGAVRLADGVEPGAPESPDPQEENASAPSPDTDSAPTAAPSTPMPPPAPILPLSIEKNWDLAELYVHASLEEGARHIRKGDWVGASKDLSTSVKRLSDGDFEARIIGHALLGRACDRKGDDTCAGTAYTKVLELATSSEAKIQEIVESGGDTATKVVPRLLLAQGEALFYKAEQKRKAAEAIQYPIYRGSGDKDDVLEHFPKIHDWIKKKRPLLDEAERAYAEILELQPTPPPTWVVLAAGRAGDMRSAFAYEFQASMPKPSEWNGTGNVPGTPNLTYEELRRMYREKLAEASVPLRQRAVEAYKSCRDHAKKHGVAATEGMRCEQRLAAMGVTP